MKIDAFTSPSVNTYGGGENPPSVGLTPDALPEAQSCVAVESSQTGVSTKNAHSASNPYRQKQEDIPHWYALRCTYGREKAAYDYMVAKGVTAFYPTISVAKMVKGKRKMVTESRLPNIFFAYGTEEQIKTFVYDNVNLPFLRFYYRHVHNGRMVKRVPMIVPDYQLEGLRIICEAEDKNTVVSLAKIPQFEKGERVRVTDGTFKGVVGMVARYQGQQRVAVIVDDLVTMATAYVPNAFLERF